MSADHNPDLSELNAIVGRLVKTQRECIGLTQGDLAEALDMPVRTLQRYEDGALAFPAALVALAAGVLKCSAASLLPTARFVEKWLSAREEAVR